MGNRMKRLSCFILSFSMIISLASCAKKDSKVSEDSDCVQAAELLLDAAVRLKSKSIKKLNKELGVGKSFESDLKELAGYKYVKVIMEKADYEIDVERIKETKKGVTVPAEVTLPDYVSALDEAEDFSDFEDNIASQKPKKYKTIALKLKFTLDDGQYTMDSEAAGDVIEHIYDDMIETITEFEHSRKPTQTTPTTPPTDTTPPVTSSKVDTTPYDISIGSGPIEIILYSQTADFASIIQEYLARNPDMDSKYTIRAAQFPDGSAQTYQSRLNAALVAGGDASPDIYIADADYVLPYTQGDLASFAAPYSDFIGDFDAKLKDAQLVQYTVDVGTNPDGEVVGLGYQGMGGMMIYSSSIAKEVFGSDDPAVVEKNIGGGSGSWDKYLKACEKLAGKGYAACADVHDLWIVCEKSATTPWVIDGHINIDPQREAYLDLCKQLTENNWTNQTGVWSANWYDAMSGKSKDPSTGEVRKVFSFFAPMWFINYTLSSYSQNPAEGFGDWRVCKAPLGFWWGGTWIMVNKNSIQDPDKKEFISRLVEWVTLDTSDDGLQYSWANGLLTGAKDTVTSKRVLAKADGSMDILGGTNPYPVYIDAMDYATASGLGYQDRDLESAFSEPAEEYGDGEITRDKAIERFLEVCTSLGIDVS